MERPTVQALAVGLSLPFDGPAARRAAERLLAAPDREASLARLYPLLLRHKTWRHALQHLRAAGADLEQLGFPARTFLDTFPVRGRELWRVADEIGGDRLTLAFLDELLSRHRGFVRDAVRELAGQVPPASFALVSGRAIEVCLPDYERRMEFDSDLLVPDVESGLQLLERLAAEGYVLRFFKLRDALRLADSSMERYRDGHSVTVGVEMGGYQLFEGPIWERARRVPWLGHEVLLPTVEDLVLMIAARTRFMRTFQQVAVNDVALLLGEHHAAIDWDYLRSQAGSHGLLVNLKLLVEHAERFVQGPLLPADLDWGSGPAHRFLLRWGRDLVAGMALGSERPPPSRGARRRFGIAVRQTAARDVASRLRSGSRVLQGLAYDWQRRFLGRAPGFAVRSLGALRPRVGSLCELRTSPLDAEARGCVREALGRAPSGLLAAETRTALRRVADALPGPGRRPHACSGFTYDLES